MSKSAPEFDQYAARYETDLQKSIPDFFAEDQYFSEYKIQYMAHRIGDSTPANLLDFGCGIGRNLCLLNEQFPYAKLWGYDVSNQSIEFARQRAAMAHLTSNPDDLPVSRFDVIFVANVFHHIPSAKRREALGQCKRLLRDGGRIYLFEHNPFNPATRFVFDHCPFDEGAVMLSRRESLELAKGAGLSVTHSGYTLFFPRPLAFLRPFERMLCWLPLGAQYCVEMAK